MAAGAAAYIVYNNLKDRGLVFVARWRKYNGKPHVDYHVDYDDGKYDGLVPHARLIKDDWETEQKFRKEQEAKDNATT